MLCVRIREKWRQGFPKKLFCRRQILNWALKEVTLLGRAGPAHEESGRHPPPRSLNVRTGEGQVNTHMRLSSV